jgi:D-alanyl-D-alanine carboxypeptidase
MTRRLALSFLLLTAAWPSRAETLQARLQSKLDELHRAAEFPGATVGVALLDGHLISVSTGLADVEHKTALRPNDLMLAGSTGKTFASAVILLAIQERKLSLDDRVEKWLGSEPWYPRLPNAHDLTLRMLMNHSSGIAEHVLDPQFLAALHHDPDKIWKPAELVAYILDKPPLFPAGQGWSYADTNYILAAMVFEKATGRRYY